MDSDTPSSSELDDSSTDSGIDVETESQGRHRRLDNGQQRTTTTMRPGENRTWEGESITPTRGSHSPRAIPQPHMKAREKT